MRWACEWASTLLSLSGFCTSGVGRSLVKVALTPRVCLSWMMMDSVGVSLTLRDNLTLVWIVMQWWLVYSSCVSGLGMYCVSEFLLALRGRTR